MFGLIPDEHEQKLIDKIKNRDYKSMRVVGRGTIMIDKEEVRKLININNTVINQ